MKSIIGLFCFTWRLFRLYSNDCECQTCHSQFFHKSSIKENQSHFLCDCLDMKYSVFFHRKPASLWPSGFSVLLLVSTYTWNSSDRKTSWNHGGRPSPERSKKLAKSDGVQNRTWPSGETHGPITAWPVELVVMETETLWCSRLVMN